MAITIAAVMIERQAGPSRINLLSTPAPTARAPSAVPVVADDDPAVVIDGLFVFVAGEALWWIDRHEHVAAMYPLPDPAGRYTLVADRATHRVWLVRLAPESIQVVAYRSRTHAELARFAVHGAASGAAVLDGCLYLITGAGWQHISISGPVISMTPTFMRGRVAITADARRHRLLLIVRGKIEARRPGNAQRVVSTSLPFYPVSLAVAGGHIWAGGWSAAGAARLVRLDPRTLRPQLQSPHPAPLIVASDAHDLLVRSGAGSAALRCLDARTGKLINSWSDVRSAAAVAADGLWRLSMTTWPQQLAGTGCSPIR
ncbi:MAG TPA: hypothetical protein VE441_05270 [Mycobacterium sp.]|nr:hypothetical protein [Mycobacterium sp.]